MWLLPWEKLPKLILGPLMVCLAVFVFYPAYNGVPSDRSAIWWGLGFLIVGVILTIKGVLQLIKQE